MPAFTAPPAVVTLQSRFDFDRTVALVTEALTSRGMTIFADIDQAAAAAKSGTTLRPTRLILFGNPKGGTPVMQANPHAALELPLKIVIWQDAQEPVCVDYLDPGALLGDGYGIDPSLTGGFRQVAQLLAQTFQ
ncbi:DUF302 domain-containing protein [Paraburkholderia saeva]|uniref:DUF302 domain-containing protein n=1 Tax=Paraburkholderia saeva TaxID=2777537 RepID=UPI001D36E0C3|nr:DUF302 domain-containing protein [Paraburkholderia saeva]CAG4885549.1 hypothetical protein R52603_00007 [Paraburkholderia saeva]